VSTDSIRFHSREDRLEDTIVSDQSPAARADHTSKVGGAGSPSRLWQLGTLVILTLAVLLRYYDLARKPLHHDEGINAYFVDRLFHQGVYHYDPANYHGPTLYYCALITSSVNELFSPANELSIVSMRVVPVLFGIATVWLLLCLRRQLGELGALAATLLTAISPAAVYWSRDFIHESLFVFFTLGIVIAAVRYRETVGTKYLVLASASVALLVATKETAVISVVVLLLAAFCSFFYVRARTRVANGYRTPRASGRVGAAPARVRFHGRKLATISLALIAFLVPYLLLYSSFLSDPAGLHKSIETFKYWVRAGTTQQTWPWYTYLGWMAEADLPPLGLGALGAALVVWRGQDRFAVFSALWAFGSLTAYSLLPYKTPWLALNFLVPLAICSGQAVTAGWGYMRSSGNERAKRLLITLALLTTMASLYQSIKLNFFAYDDERYPYVYMQTRRETLSLVEQINNIATRSGTGKQTTITITTPDYWPLPWYLRDYKFAGYPGRIVDPKETIIIASEQQEPDLPPSLREHYQRVGSYPLRPGVNLVLYASNRKP